MSYEEMTLSAKDGYELAVRAFALSVAIDTTVQG